MTPFNEQKAILVTELKKVARGSILDYCYVISRNLEVTAENDDQLLVAHKVEALIVHCDETLTKLIKELEQE